MTHMIQPLSVIFLQTCNNLPLVPHLKLKIFSDFNGFCNSKSFVMPCTGVCVYVTPHIRVQIQWILLLLSFKFVGFVGNILTSEEAARVTTHSSLS